MLTSVVLISTLRKQQLAMTYDTTMQAGLCVSIMKSLTTAEVFQGSVL